jgi:hypothetical protein
LDFLFVMTKKNTVPSLGYLIPRLTPQEVLLAAGFLAGLRKCTKSQRATVAAYFCAWQKKEGAK